MIKIPFLNKTKRLLGIDIGTFSTKMVELSYSQKEGVFLENYGEKFNEFKEEDVYRTPRKKVFPLSHQKIAENIRKILDEAEVKRDEAVFSIPDFMTFFTVFRIPSMPKEEMASAIQFEARQHIPLPLKEVALDWSVIEESQNEKKMGPKILLVAVPSKVISEYQKVAELAKVKLLSIEAEVFSLARSSVPKEDINKTVQLIDLGVQSTTISIVKDGIVKTTYSVEFSEIEILGGLVEKLDIGYDEADRIMNETGLNENSNEGKILCDQFDFLIDEIRQTADNFLRIEGGKVDKIILAGGISLSPGLKNYLEMKAKKEFQIANPFLKFSYPPILKEVLEKIGPRYAIATGLALRDRE